LKLAEKITDSTSSVDTIPELIASPGSPFIHPPTYRTSGGKDDMFEASSHGKAFYEKLKKKGVKCYHAIVSEAEHGFDIGVEIGSERDKMSLKPAVEWLVSI
jgi:acetyl esterase/lipase